ncbi:spermine oxidase [Aplysia californica]|uniref:Spermine oxidase n=1 Tax=Aplysia californica TaxID=6500 RepID=A0ABM0JAA7_APLCA|nr:spermine oxidase [Aplysia californica]
MATQNDSKVVVIGAGIAGVSAALKLVYNGIPDVTLLEAQDYIGGRVKAAMIDGSPADLGAQFIHGRTGNPVYEIAAKLKRIPFATSVNPVEESLTNPGDIFYTSSGHKIERDEVKELMELLSEVLENEVTDGYGKSVQEALESVYSKFLSENEGKINPAMEEVYEAAYRWFSKYVQVDNATDDLSQLSLDSEYVVLPGDRYTIVDNGMSGLVATLAEQLPPGVVQLNTPVSRIDWTCEETDNPRQSSGSKPIRVTCENGNTIEADHVIVTISIGCLKATHKTLFQPLLPAPVQEAVEHTGFGLIGKIFLQFEEPFWEDHRESTQDNFFESYEFLWLDSHLPTIQSDRSKRKTKSGHPWWYGIHSMETMYMHPRVLEIFLNREQVELSDDLPDEEVMAVCTDVMRAFIKDIPIPDPVAIHRTNWFDNPYTRGTYSYASTQFRNQDKKHFGRPVPSSKDPQVLFAGEAYSKEFQSTFHGALISGDNTADFLLSQYGLKPHRKLIDLVSP